MDNALSFTSSPGAPARPVASPGTDDRLARPQTPLDGTTATRDELIAPRQAPSEKVEGNVARAEAAEVSAGSDGAYARRRRARPDAGIAPLRSKRSALRNLNKSISIVLIVFGLGLVLHELAAVISTGPESDVFFPNSPPDKAFWTLIGGLVMAGLGAGRLLCGSKSP